VDAERADLVIFDCDGVLVDSEPIAAVVSQRVLADLGWKLSIDEVVHRFVGGSSEDFQSQIEAYLGSPLPAGWNDQYAHWYREAFERELRAIDGIEDALDAIDMPWCVASNSGRNRVVASLARTGLLSRFDGRIFSAEEVDRGKPAPDLFLWAAHKSGVAPERCVVVEDSAYGVAAARSAGMRVLAYAGGLTDPARLAGPGTTIFGSMAELPALIAGTHGER
jgi:HAD superfamily hydrolase (TIGR01509 family)